MKKYLSKLSFLVIGLSLAATVSYLNAWTGPTQTAPAGNVAAPLNTSVNSQAKNTSILVGSTLNIGGILSSDQLLAFTRVSAGEYCDVNGENCSSSTSGGSSVPAGTVAAFNLTTCPSGWIPADGTSGTVDLRGSFVRGYGTSTAGTAASGAWGVFQEDEFKSHRHYISSMRSQNIGGGGSNNIWDVDSGSTYTNYEGGAETRPDNVALLFCQKDGTSAGGGSSTSLVKYGGSYLVGAGGALNAYGMGACPTPNIVTGTCSCPSGYTARLTSQAAYYHFSPWDSTYSGYTCESL